MAPSHYLNQYWLIISVVLWHSSQGNFMENTPQDIKISLENQYVKLFPHLPADNKLTQWGLVRSYGDRDLDQHWLR